MYARNDFTQPDRLSAFARQMQQSSQEAPKRFTSTTDTYNELDIYPTHSYTRREPSDLSGGTSLPFTSPLSYSPPSQLSGRIYGQAAYGGIMGVSTPAQGYPFSNQSGLQQEVSHQRSTDVMDFGYSLSLPSEAPSYNIHRASLPISHNPRPPRRPSNRDEFDGVNQYLPPLNPAYIAAQERDIPHLPTNLVAQEQDKILSMVTLRLSRCAYDFVAKYEFPIPVDNKLRPVTRPEDREWTEWVYLLKRLATKRRIPARLLYQGQIKQLVTVLENSLEMRCVVRMGSRPLRDDRNVLQLISAGIQVAKILKDAPAVEDLDALYVETDAKIAARVGRNGRGFR